MMSSFRASVLDRAVNKRRRKTAAKSVARRRAFPALGWEQLEGRVLLTAAGTITWTGGSTTSGNWSDAANWDLNRAPINGDSLVFPAGAQRLTNNDNIGGLSVNSITFEGMFGGVSAGYHIGGTDLTLGAGGIIDESTYIPPPAPGTIAGLVNEIDVNLTLSAAQSWSSNDNIGLHRLGIDGNVANGGFTLTATGPGVIDMAGQTSGGGGLTVAANAAGSAPTVELLSANTYTGATAVARGTLIVNGSTEAASTVLVSNGGTLGGSGTVAGQITIWSAGGPGGAVLPAGKLDPGSGPDLSSDTGTLSNNGGVSFAPNPILSPQTSGDASGAAEFNVQLGGTAANPASDQLSSTGTVSLLAGTLNLTALAGAGPFNAGQQFVIVQAGAAIKGTFAGLPEGSTVSDGAQNFTISYANDRVTLTVQGVSVAASTYLNGQAGDGTAATFVHNLYRELLGREPDSAGQTYWLNVFAQASSNGGTATAQRTLVAAFLNSSEYHEHLVEGMYTDLLHRSADAGGLAFWSAALANGMDEENVLASIVGSDEYLADALGPGVHPDNTISDAQAWVNALYRDLLGRTADSGGLAYWVQQAQSVSRTTVALQFLGEGEVEHKLLNGNYPGAAGSVGAPGTPAVGDYALADLTGNGWDNLYFQGNLSAAAVDTLFGQLQAGATYAATISGMLDMTQYLG